jgi:hypothetical protein
MELTSGPGFDAEYFPKPNLLNFKGSPLCDKYNTTQVIIL